MSLVDGRISFRSPCRCMFRFAGWQKTDFQTGCNAPYPAKDKGRKGTKHCDSPDTFPDDCPLLNEFVIRFGTNISEKEGQENYFRKDKP